MCRGHDPLFSGQSEIPSLPIYYQCAAHIMCPPFSILNLAVIESSHPVLAAAVVVNPVNRLRFSGYGV